MNKVMYNWLWVMGLLLVFSLITHHSLLITSIKAQEKSIQLQNVDCKASDSKTFRDCLEGAKRGEVAIITVTKQISCQSSNDCKFELNDIKSQLLISGIAGNRAGFKRTGDYSYPILSITNSDGLRIGNLSFSDEDNSQCIGGGFHPDNCASPILVENSRSISLGTLFMENAKRIAITIKSSKNISISDSKINNSLYHAISVETSEAILIQNNTLSNSRSNAILFSAKGPSIIAGNKLSSNHRNALYAPCQTPCLGGQLRINGGTTNLTIQKNTIKDGFIEQYDELGLYPSGVELFSEDVSGINLSCNKIFNNKGNGVVAKKLQGLTIKNNIVYGNGINFNIPDFQLGDNCTNASCNTTCN